MCGSYPGADADAAPLMQISHLTLLFSSPLRMRADISQTASLLFEPDLQLQILEAGSSDLAYSRHLHAAGLGVSWLPRGRYRVECALHDLELPAGDFELRVVASAAIGGDHSVTGERSIRFHNPAPIKAAGARQPAWSLRSEANTPPVEELAWKRGHADWFFRHFDHAALVVTLPPLPDGAYLVRWYVVLLDGDASESSFNFYVGDEAAAAAANFTPADLASSISMDLEIS